MACGGPSVFSARTDVWARGFARKAPAPAAFGSAARASSGGGWKWHLAAGSPARSSREVRLRVPDFFSVVHFSRGTTLPTKKGTER